MRDLGKEINWIVSNKIYKIKTTPIATPIATDNLISNQSVHKVSINLSIVFSRITNNIQIAHMGIKTI